MGIAAYNRGSKVIAQRIEDEYRKNRPSDITEQLQILNNEPPGDVELFDATIVRFGGCKENNSRGWYVMNRPGDWREYSFGPFRSLIQIAKKYNVYFLDIKKDRIGQYAIIVPRKQFEKSTPSQIDAYKQI